MSGAIYQVWQADCHSCGVVISYGEDEGAVPDECEDCGEPFAEPNDEEEE